MTPSLSTSLQSLCDDTTRIKKSVCSMLSKSDFGEIAITDIYVRGKIIGKDIIAKHFLDLVKRIDSVSDILNPVFESSSTMSNNLDKLCDGSFDKLLSDAQIQLDTSTMIKAAVTDAMKQHSAETEKMVKELQDTVRNLEQPTQRPGNTVRNDKPVTPDLVAREPPAIYYKDDFITQDEEKTLMDYFNTVEFKGEGTHSVKNYGVEYSYGGARDSKNVEQIPNELDGVIEKIKEHYPEVDINQCLVNRYEGDNSKLGEHSDDENTINPKSLILSVSIGHTRTVTFRNKFNGDQVHVAAKGRSLYTMTKSSQDSYTHRIDEEPGSTLRYSITFRSVAPQFRKSTLVIGDSNSKWLQFGEGKGTFGKSLPGDRVPATRVQDINPLDCAGYSNVVLMVGTNDMRRMYIKSKEDIRAVADTMRGKVDAIRRLRPDINLVLLPVLPTRYHDMNHNIYWYNTMIYDDIIGSGHYFRVSMPNTNEFYDNEGLLKTAFLRNSPGDAVHLNSRGLGAVVRMIKQQVLGPRRTTSRSYSTALKEGKGVVRLVL